MSDTLNCGSGGGADTYFGLRIASVFIILACSTTGALFPVLARRTKRFEMPQAVWEFAKYFGSGVIIATSFIHLLSPGLSELTSPCLGEAWQEYPYALALAMLSIFSLFIVEIVAFRWGTGKLKKLGITYDAHGHSSPSKSHAAHGPEASPKETPMKAEDDPEYGGDEIDNIKHSTIDDSVSAQIIGIAILEFGVLLHSVLIGLTLAVDPDFKILFVVIIFHQTFEGLGVGTRLAQLRLPPKYKYIPVAGALAYGLTTPIGIAAGLGVRTTYNPNSTTASIVSGVMDSFSAGILIYTGLVELLAHEFLFNPDMINASNAKLAYALCCMLFGTGIMALLGRWA